MSERLRRIEDLVPADIEAERLLQLAPALWRQWGVVVVSLEQIDDAEQRVALQALAGAFGKALYGPREASAQLRVGDSMVSADGARWEALSASEGHVLARRVSDGALASFHQPGG